MKKTLFIAATATCLLTLNSVAMEHKDNTKQGSFDAVTYFNNYPDFPGGAAHTNRPFKLSPSSKSSINNKIAGCLRISDDESNSIEVIVAALQTKQK